MAMWLQSPGHRSALLAADATVVGSDVRLGAMINGSRGSLWTLHIGRPV
jgi:hypothetical protein